MLVNAELLLHFEQCMRGSAMGRVCVQKRDISLSVKINMVNKLLEMWREVGRDLGRLLMFVSLNMQALRKIVKKQNKLVRALSTRICLLAIVSQHA